MLHIKRLAVGAALAVLASLLSAAFNPAVSAFAANSAAPAAVVNTYPYGQCTYFAKAMRTDIGNHWGNARYWAAAARRNGFPVDGHPRVGDVVVFGAYVQGNSAYGHVGIVTQVRGSQFLVRSMWGNEANGRIHLNWHHTGGGVSFIHKKGSKPAATTTPKPAAKATTPAKSTKATTPAKSTTAKATTPAKSTKATTPAKSTKATTPAKSTKATTPAKTATATAPAKSTKATTPAKTTKTPAAKPKTTPAAKPTAKSKSNK